MSSISRRQFVATAAVGFGAAACPALNATNKSVGGHRPVPMLHVSDLFRPHNDPDDHWDLACVYSLAWQGKADLKAILIDYPEQGRSNDPDVLSVAQLNYLTGKAVPTVVGSPRWITPNEADSRKNELALRGIRSMLQLLRTSPEPIVINILGSCRDVAIAGSLEPELFAEKCKAIYLNAGSGTPDPKKAAKLEWNVSLDPRAYSTIFTLPCPVYWMPCFEELGRTPAVNPKLPEYGTYYRFRQAEILPQLSNEMQNFFAFMFKHGQLEKEHTAADGIRADWLGALVGPPDSKLLERLNAMERNMWCTGGFLHAVGHTVTRTGEIVSLEDANDPVFTFDSIDVSCAASGVTTWRPAQSSPPRYVFHVRDPQRYPAAMTAALKSLMLKLNTASS
jgi:hypothetical protein